MKAPYIRIVREDRLGRIMTYWKVRPAPPDPPARSGDSTKNGTEGERG